MSFWASLFVYFAAAAHWSTHICWTDIHHLYVIELFEKIRKSHKHSVIPISIFLDNAKYQACKDVAEKADSLNIELMFLPSYSPNLNLIERLWKWLKKDCLNCKYYSKFSEFKAAIDCSLNKIINREAQKDMDSILSLNFQLFK